MEKDGTLKILNYYLEYEIYNLANSTQIKTDIWTKKKVRAY